jgi:hypothetical protein
MEFLDAGFGVQEQLLSSKQVAHIMMVWLPFRGKRQAVCTIF